MTGEEHYRRAETILARIHSVSETDASRVVLAARAEAHLHAAEIATRREMAGLKAYGSST
jgi:hypothetical protein